MGQCFDYRGSVKFATILFGIAWTLSVIGNTPANLCPPWRYVVNEVRRLADDYDDYVVAR